MGFFDDGQPAVTLARVGSGYGVYIATQADGNLARNRDSLLKDVIKMIADRAEKKPHLTIDYPEKKAREIDPHVLDAPLRTEILLVSYLNKAAHVNLSLGESKRTVENIRYGLLEQNPLEFSQINDEVQLALEMKPRQVISIGITWKSALGRPTIEKEVS